MSVKKVSKSSAVIEVVGGGKGGQRREFNVLKRLRIAGALLILLWKCDIEDVEIGRRLAGLRCRLRVMLERGRETTRMVLKHMIEVEG